MKVKQIYKLFILIVIAFYSTSSAQLDKSDIKNLSVGADLIITEKVTNQNSKWNADKSRIFTDVTITVKEYLKGISRDDKIVITLPGGEIGEVGEFYTHMPAFSDEEEVLVFIRRDDKEKVNKVFRGESGKISLGDEKSAGKIKQIEMLKEEIKSYIGKENK